MASPMKRRESDLMKLMMKDYKVDLIDDGTNEFHVYMKGPPDSPYSGGLWKIHVELPEDYPYSSPSVGFVNKIYHPNIDERSGSVCLDVLNQRWTPMFDLVLVFEVFLPQLLVDPNPYDPLNEEAANLMLGGDSATYEQRVREYCERFAKPEDVGGDESEESSDDEVSEDGEDSGDEATTSGPVDPSG